MPPHTDYALVTVLEHLGEDPDALNIEWAEFVGDASTLHTFEVTTTNPLDAYFEVQLYDVGTFGHEVLVNGEPLTGFDLPPSDGWQLWMDAVTDAMLQQGENTVQIVRDGESDDEFAIGNVVVHWRSESSPER
ncbi:MULTISPECIES: DUF7383 domain-containing protein [Haloferacaceae]|uniref:Uncharacterized protein n=1 Tax=Halorubrum glutamatedens TaxID=2707018 RepID=A0ABD5QX88_9EURY|nr:hypothetical protein [Halobellus captivus]